LTSLRARLGQLGDVPRALDPDPALVNRCRRGCRRQLSSLRRRAELLPGCFAQRAPRQIERRITSRRLQRPDEVLVALGIEIGDQALMGGFPARAKRMKQLAGLHGVAAAQRVSFRLQVSGDHICIANRSERVADPAELPAQRLGLRRLHPAQNGTEPAHGDAHLMDVLGVVAEARSRLVAQELTELRAE
jgi:hypothetical protein